MTCFALAGKSVALESSARARSPSNQARATAPRPQPASCKNCRREKPPPCRPSLLNRWTISPPRFRKCRLLPQRQELARIEEDPYEALEVVLPDECRGAAGFIGSRSSTEDQAIGTVDLSRRIVANVILHPL